MYCNKINDRLYIMMVKFKDDFRKLIKKDNLNILPKRKKFNNYFFRELIFKEKKFFYNKLKI